MKHKITIILLLLFTTISLSAANYIPSEGNLKAREKFQDAKFGIFIHWGFYSMLADGEWIMNSREINYKEYAKLAGGFYPSQFNADKWVSTIKASGAKYITITSRHHDGFSMFGTKQSTYNIVDATPFRRDILKELKEACEKENITLNFYYSLLDWYRLDYPIGESGRHTGRPTNKQNWRSYYNFMKAQLKELLTEYGNPGMIWFDGEWDHKKDKKPFDWELEQLYSYMHKIKPDCLIANNHHHAILQGEDVQLFEKDLPGENKAGMSGGVKIGSLPLETCETMNNSWGYNITDKNYKSAKEIIRLLVNAAGKGGNLLLNIGPRPDGNIPDEAVSLLQEVGQWLSNYGESIYGTRAGLFPPQYWGASTTKNNIVYIHILNYNNKNIYLPTGNIKFKNISLYGKDVKLRFKKCNEGILVELPEIPTGIDYILKLEKVK